MTAQVLFLDVFFEKDAHLNAVEEVYVKFFVRTSANIGNGALNFYSISLNFLFIPLFG